MELYRVSCRIRHDKFEVIVQVIEAQEHANSYSFKRTISDVVRRIKKDRLGEIRSLTSDSSYSYIEQYAYCLENEHLKVISNLRASVQSLVDYRFTETKKLYDIYKHLYFEEIPVSYLSL